MYPFDWQQRIGSDASYVDTVWSLEHQQLRRQFSCDHKAKDSQLQATTEFGFGSIFGMGLAQLVARRFCNLEVSLEVARQDLLCILWKEMLLLLERYLLHETFCIILLFQNIFTLCKMHQHARIACGILVLVQEATLPHSQSPDGGCCCCCCCCCCRSQWL